MGAAVASAGIIAYSHILTKPWWLTKQPMAAGWTIYPPLSALPQADVPDLLDFNNLVLYPGLLRAACLAGGLALLLLLASRIAARTLPADGRLTWKKMILPIVFLLPVSFHFAGEQYYTHQLTQTINGGNYEVQEGGIYKVFGHGASPPNSGEAPEMIADSSDVNN
jgi:hypothetical protein